MIARCGLLALTGLLFLAGLPAAHAGTKPAAGPKPSPPQAAPPPEQAEIKLSLRDAIETLWVSSGLVNSAVDLFAGRPHRCRTPR